MFIHLGRIQEADSLLQILFSAAPNLEVTWITGLAHEGIARARAVTGDLDAARTHFNNAIAIRVAGVAAASMTFMAASCRAYFAEMEFAAGNVEHAIETVYTAITSLRSLHETFDAAALRYNPILIKALTDLAAYLIASDQFDEAKIQPAKPYTSIKCRNSI